jgi:hypothetical protein
MFKIPYRAIGGQPPDIPLAAGQKLAVVVFTITLEGVLNAIRF